MSDKLIARFADLIDLRERDLRDTLVDIEGPVDVMLIGIWTPMARPALSVIAPHLRTMTLPFEGGLECTVKEASQ